MCDYDEVGTHILIDGNIADQRRKLITHSARNGFLYTMDRFNGQIIGAKPYLDGVTGPRALTRRPASPSTTIRQKISSPTPVSPTSMPMSHSKGLPVDPGR